MTRGEFQPKTWYSDDFLIKAEKRAIQADPSNRDEIRRDFQERRMLLNKFRRNWNESNIIEIRQVKKSGAESTWMYIAQYIDDHGVLQTKTKTGTSGTCT